MSETTDQPDNSDDSAQAIVTAVRQRRRLVFADKGGNVYEQFAHWHCGLPMVAMIEVFPDDPANIDELIDAAKDIRDNPGTDLHGSVGFCAIENPKLDRLRKALEASESR